MEAAMRAGARLSSAFVLSLSLAGAASAQDAPFCVVSAAGTHCVYTDAVACRQAAAVSRGACVARVPAGDSGNSGLKPLFAPGDLLDLQRRAQDDAERQVARQLVPPGYGAAART